MSLHLVHHVRLQLLLLMFFHVVIFCFAACKGSRVPDRKYLITACNQYSCNSGPQNPSDTRGFPKGFCDVRALLISWKKDTQQRRGAAGTAGARSALGAGASSSSL